MPIRDIASIIGFTQVAVTAAYEALDPEQLHGWMRDLLLNTPGLVLDLGAGTGRDAA